jgi:hypothetical protein
VCKQEATFSSKTSVDFQQNIRRYIPEDRSLQYAYCIVTYRPIARQRLGKHIPAQAYARNNRTSTARQWISQHASLTIEAVFYAWSVQSGYKEEVSWAGESEK